MRQGFKLLKQVPIYMYVFALMGFVIISGPSINPLNLRNLWFTSEEGRTNNPPTWSKYWTAKGYEPAIKIDGQEYSPANLKEINELVLIDGKNNIFIKDIMAWMFLAIYDGAYKTDGSMRETDYVESTGLIKKKKYRFHIGENEYIADQKTTEGFIKYKKFRTVYNLYIPMKQFGEAFGFELKYDLDDVRGLIIFEIFEIEIN